MNAKFEKWCVENGISIRPHGAGYKSYDTDIRHHAWKAAIQSLEVTPELRMAYWNAMGYTTFTGEDTEADQAINAILTAIKEQAK